MPHLLVKPGLRVLMLLALIPLGACFEVENGPAFSGGDEVPGLTDTIYKVGQIESDDEEGMQPVDPDDVEEWFVRRALNGSYVFSRADGGDNDRLVVRPRFIEDGDYVIEYSPQPDENWLGILQVSGDGDARQFAFCISLYWGEFDMVGLAAAHGARADDSGYAGLSIGADDPDALFSYMADVWSRTDINRWDCTVMGTEPPEGFDQDVPGKTIAQD